MARSQTERNRQNAQASTGPKTEEGKIRSSRNSLKTGLYSVTALLPSEDQEEYLAHAASYLVDLKAQGPVQCDLVKIVSDAAWRLRRIRGLEATQTRRVAWLLQCGQGGTRIDEQYAAEVHTLDILGRHEQRVQNSMIKTIKLLKDLQKEAQLENSQSGFVPKPANPVHPATAAMPESTPETTPEIQLDPDPDLQKAAA
jgi:hypothetical protein